MPLWIIYHAPNTYNNTTKQAFANDITKMYTTFGLPAFYVVVNFIEVPVSNTFVGGETRTAAAGAKPFVRLVIQHLAVRLPESDSVYEKITALIDQVLKPHVADKGYDWEFNVEEMERRLWKINGLVPPPSNSEEEKLWVAENRAVPY